MSILQNLRATASCISDGHCELLSLSREKVTMMMEEFPFVREELIDMQKERAQT